MLKFCLMEENVVLPVHVLCLFASDLEPVNMTVSKMPHVFILVVTSKIWSVFSFYMYFQQQNLDLYRDYVNINDVNVYMDMT